MVVKWSKNIKMRVLKWTLKLLDWIISVNFIDQGASHDVRNLLWLHLLTKNLYYRSYRIDFSIYKRDLLSQWNIDLFSGYTCVMT